MSSVIVCGNARQLVQPDRAVVSLGISVVAADAAGALDQVAERSATLSAVLGRLGFAATDWVTDGVTVAEEWEWRNEANTLVGHRASTGVTVTVRQLDAIAPLLRATVDEAGGTIRQLRWEVDADHPVQHELLGRAAVDARRRASAYAGALGLELGAVELISERPIGAGGPDPAADAAMPMFAMARGKAAAPELSVSGGQIELTAEVHVRFALFHVR
jgi:uncharacterized protein YggE